ncbi:hypothetical protein [Xanthomonas nasturtii]|uniref:Uncharacterized protein n=1 Tax=Xanthomonas nasturtii TaxID=1843581 RepID=A0ABT0LUL9_9XANT|nr:hypothetical protein [Xanthomonas nasturtii]MCL1552827.1 hypothetical protein [Xanthomonas nasturtii]MCL1556985.1 hypothetical protein [Xanthomonas nasturtii]MCL1561594.1 hypothetical protein [Xanthomonas nasturtii]
MSNINDRIDRAARAFNVAASELAEAMAERLRTEAPQIEQQLVTALEKGERMLLALEMSPAAPSIWWSTIDDYQQMKRIMTIPSKMPTRQ